jgi:hypothetical protein
MMKPCIAELTIEGNLCRLECHTISRPDRVSERSKLSSITR